MLRRRSRPTAGPAPRPAAIRVLAGRPQAAAAPSGDLLPTTAGRAQTAARTAATSAATLTAATTATTTTVAPVTGRRPHTVDERAAHIRAMARAASRRAAGR